MIFFYKNHFIEKMDEITEDKRKLSYDEIEYVLSFIKPNIYIPIETAESIVRNVKNETRKQLVNIEIYPQLIEELKSEIEKFYISTYISPGESVGIIMAESIFLNSSDSIINKSEIAINSGFNSCSNRSQYFDSFASFLAIFNRKERSLSPSFSLASI